MYEITKELARAAKYWFRMENAVGTGADNYKKAHEEFTEKMEEYEQAAGISEEEAQENVMIVVEILRNRK